MLNAESTKGAFIIHNSKFLIHNYHKMRAYTKVDIGRLYDRLISRPTAKKMVDGWLDNVAGLRQALEADGWHVPLKFTPKQKEIFFEYVGKPESALPVNKKSD